MMFGRKTRSVIPEVNNYDSPVFEKRQNRRDAVERYYNKTARDLVPLSAGQSVYYQNPDRRGWEKGTVSHSQGPRSYVIEGKEGGVYRRNRIHLRPDLQDSSESSETDGACIEKKINDRDERDNEEAYCSPTVDVPRILRRSARLQEKMGKGELSTS